LRYFPETRAPPVRVSWDSGIKYRRGHREKTLRRWSLVPPTPPWNRCGERAAERWTPAHLAAVCRMMVVSLTMVPMMHQIAVCVAQAGCPGHEIRVGGPRCGSPRTIFKPIASVCAKAPATRPCVIGILGTWRRSLSLPLSLDEEFHRGTHMVISRDRELAVRRTELLKGSNIERAPVSGNTARNHSSRTCLGITASICGVPATTAQRKERYYPG